MKNRKTNFSSLEQKKLARKIHNCAYTNAKKNPKKFSKLFNEIWASKLQNER